MIKKHIEIFSLPTEVIYLYDIFFRVTVQCKCAHPEGNMPPSISYNSNKKISSFVNPPCFQQEITGFKSNIRSSGERRWLGGRTAGLDFRIIPVVAVYQ